MAAAPERLSREVTVRNSHGLHARTAALLVKTANRFQCEIYLARDGNSINVKSIMGVLMLAAGQGTVLTLSAEGDDAGAAVEALSALFEAGFNET
ncbi:MAG: HPr family phosphocarrier protein [Deltaproteobacteria bacterium]